jgi:putative ABC transport system substrate-binding protein
MAAFEPMQSFTRRLPDGLVPQGGIMSQVGRRKFLLATSALLAASLARAQQPPARGHLIGILEYGTSAALEPVLLPFKEGLREGGFVEGQNLRIEYRFAGNDFHKINRLAEDLVRAKVQVIFTPTTWGVHAAKAATTTVPIVFSGVADPVVTKFVQSLARPGGNITGISGGSQELTKKRVELMREMFPTASRLGVIYDEDSAKACQIELKDIAQAGRQLGVEVREYRYLEKTDLQGAFDSALRAQIAAVLIPTTIDSRRFGAELISLSEGSRIPTVHNDRMAVEAGGLMSYAPPSGWASRRAGNYVARILKGAKPAELPVEMPTTYELVINLKTARSMGVKIPRSILLRADRVIE